MEAPANGKPAADVAGAQDKTAPDGARQSVRQVGVSVRWRCCLLLAGTNSVGT